MKHAKKAFLASLLATLLCVTMLIGTTFAWFTDSVTSGGNIIKSGSLNIDLLVKGGDTTFTDYTSVKANQDPIFTYDRWEPGYTSWANAKIQTTGNLALKYNLNLAANGTVSALAEVIDVYYSFTEVAIDPTDRAGSLANLSLLGTLKQLIDGTVSLGTDATLIPDLTLYNGTAVTAYRYLTLALHMQETAGNEYQLLEIGSTFSLQILATQYTYEDDSFDDQYDVNALYPNARLVASNTALESALADPTIDEVVLSQDITNSGVLTIDGTTLDGGGNTITVSGTGSDCGLNAKSGTIENVTVTGSGRGIGTGSSGTYAMDGDLTINYVTVDGPTYAINIGKGNNHRLVVTNSTLNGWTSMDDVEASFTDCSFGKGTTGSAANYACFAIYDTVTFTNCTFSSDYSFYGRGTSTGTITLTNCTHGTDAVTAANFATLFDTPHDSDFDYLMNHCEIYVDGTRVNP